MTKHDKSTSPVGGYTVIYVLPIFEQLADGAENLGEKRRRVKLKNF